MNACVSEWMSEVMKVLQETNEERRKGIHIHIDAIYIYVEIYVCVSIYTCVCICGDPGKIHPIASNILFKHMWLPAKRGVCNKARGPQPSHTPLHKVCIIRLFLQQISPRLAPKSAPEQELLDSEIRRGGTRARHTLASQRDYWKNRPMQFHFKLVGASRGFEFAAL